MGKSTEVYRHPPPPPGYVFEVKIKPPADEILAFLLDLAENIETYFKNDQEIDPSYNLREFVIMTSDDESSTEEQVKKEDNKDNSVSASAVKRAGSEKKDVASSSTKTAQPKKLSEKVSPKKRRIRRRSSDSSDDDSSFSRESRRRSPPSDRRRLKTDKRTRRRSDSLSSSSSHYSRPMSYRSLSPTRSIKQEVAPEHLFGSYHCDVCNITVNSKATYDSHVIGKKHKKAYNKAMNIVDTAARSVASAEVESKRPKVGPGIVRRKLKTAAFIQGLVDEKIKYPTPGLHYVTEIRGFTETTYYCSLCDAPCSGNSILPHLGGFKHMLKSLKMYDPDLYDRISYKQKYLIEDRVRNVLRSIVEIEGTGMITVEEEVLSVEPDEDVQISRSLSARPGPSSQPDVIDFQEYYELTTIPDTTKSGYYCKLCQAHMNSYDMWNNHISGKRHITNARKMPGSMPSKIKTIPMADVRPNLMDLIKDIDEPIVGLNHVKETQNHNTLKDMYQCYLCGACLNSGDIVDHLVSQKHRVALLKEIQHECLEIVKDMDINGSNAHALVAEVCAVLESEHGRGKPTVFFSKDCFPL